MKKILAYTLLYIFAFQLSFGLKIDNLGRIEATKGRERTASRSESDTRYVSMIIEIADEDALGELESIGAVVPYVREGMALAYVPSEAVGELDNIHNVARCATSRKASLHLDRAVPATHADRVLSGQGFSSPYTGRGVVVGFSDIGFDAGHAAFTGRVAKIVHAVDSTAMIVYGDPTTWQTDSREEFHATHVAGILAGADTGSAYQGLARGSEIVAATSCLDDVSILVGVEEIIDYAKSTGRPAVINLSLGSTMGPHDGTDLFCRYLDSCAKEAAILLAAGNEGKWKMHAKGNGEMSVMIDTYNWADIMVVNGFVDLWSDRGRPVAFRVRVWDSYEKQICYEGDWIDPQDDLYEYEFSEILTGKIIGAGEINPYNGRYNVTIGLNLRTLELYPGQTWARHSIVLDFRGGEGDALEAFTKGNMGFFAVSASKPFITGGDSEQSVSSMAFGANTVCVGSATTADHTPLLQGGESDWTAYEKVGTVSAYTSYGMTPEGVTLPHFCAPGAYVVSAFNSHMLEEYPSMLAKMAAESPTQPGNYYYAECGTSMATPHAAGIFALWLEADPTLTGPELRDIAMKTAGTAGVDPANPRTGAGMIDAAAGLAYILNQLGEIDAVESVIDVRRVGNRLEVKGYDGPTLRAEVYTLAGVKVFDGVAQGAPLPDGPVLVRLTSETVSITKKLM